jgi:hypothetical protein
MFCRLTVVCKKRKPSSKTDGRENYAYRGTKERFANETRVAATPKTVEQLLKLGLPLPLKAARVIWQVSMTKPLSRRVQKL